MSFDASLEEVEQRGNVAAQPHATARLFEVLAPHAAKLRIVPNEVRQLAALLHEVAARKPVDLLLEPRRADQLAQHGARVVEAEGLVEIRRDQKCFGGGVCRSFIGSSLIHVVN